MKKPDYHGWSRSDKTYAIHIGMLPERKKPALYMQKEGAFYPLAFFKGEEEAAEAIKVLDELIPTVEERCCK